jgi:hypothetical protein
VKTLAPCLAAALLLAGCAMPSTTVRTTDTRPSIAIAGGKPGTVLLVDGQLIGDAASYDGNPLVLRLEPGTHEVEIRAQDGKLLFAQKIFVESELKVIQVH